MSTPETTTLPPNAVESGGFYLWLDDDGILIAVNKPSILDTLKDATEKIAMVVQLSGGIPRPLLVDATETKSVAREAREAYAQAGKDGKVTALALVTGSVVSRIIANFFLNFHKPPIPVKLFNSRGPAKDWLTQYR